MAHRKFGQSKNQEPSPSAQTVASIDDLLLQILSLLRSKPLARFKSVSKHWNSLISDLKFPPKPAEGLIINQIKADHFFAYVFPFEKTDAAFTLLPEPAAFIRLPEPADVVIKIMHGCSGLFVCSDKENKHYFVVNPTTMQRKMLPEPKHLSRILAMCLAFDPSKSSCYKVVCVSGLKLQDRDREYEYDRFQVYSSETSSWRYNTSMKPFRGYFDMENGVYWNGALHWIPVSSSESNSIYFDPDDEGHQIPRVFPTPPAPYYINGGGNASYFGESCGCLHYVGKEMTEEVIVYEMKRDYSEWVVKYRVHDSIHSLIWCRVKVGAFFQGVNDGDCVLVLWDKRRIIRHNIVSGAFEILHYLPSTCIGVPLPYFESICPV